MCYVYSPLILSLSPLLPVTCCVLPVNSNRADTCFIRLARWRYGRPAVGGGDNEAHSTVEKGLSSTCGESTGPDCVIFRYISILCYSSLLCVYTACTVLYENTAVVQFIV